MTNQFFFLSLLIYFFPFCIFFFQANESVASGNGSSVISVHPIGDSTIQVLESSSVNSKESAALSTLEELPLPPPPPLRLPASTSLSGRPRRRPDGFEGASDTSPTRSRSNSFEADDTSNLLTPPPPQIPRGGRYSRARPTQLSYDFHFSSHLFNL